MFLEKLSRPIRPAAESPSPSVIPLPELIVGYPHSLSLAGTRRHALLAYNGNASPDGMKGWSMDAVVAQPRRWTRDEYERLAGQGFFQPDERLELLNGEILAMTPQKGSHAQAVGLTLDALRQAFGTQTYLRSQLPLALGADSMPEPDVAIIAGSVRDYPDHPTTAQLVVEIADTSLSLDRKRKGPIYARAGIPEYWIVNLVDRIVEVYREPIETADGWHYRLVHRAAPGDSVTPLALTSSVKVDDLLP